MAVVEEGGSARDDARPLVLPIRGGRRDVDRARPGVAALEERLERERTARVAAEETSRRKSELVASVSHELRTPIGCIIGLADLALGTDLTPEQREHLALLRTSAHGLLGLLNELLDLAKIEAGQMALDVTSFSLRNLLDDAVRPLALTAEEQGTPVETHVAADVPDRLLGPAGGLRQIVTNLVANAVRFTPDGTVVVCVEVQGRPASGLWLRFEVRDTGAGIPGAQLDAIFGAFAQASTGNGGTGLGLSIARRLAVLMGGRIEVESVEGAGSTFRLVAPFGVDGDGVALLLPVPSPMRLPGRALRVLVADDHSVSRRVTEAVLSRAGHHATLATTGRQALGHCERERFDVILLDGHMPGLDGFATARAIREREKRTSAAATPIVALTARAMRGDRQRFLAAGFDAYLNKPVDGDEVLRVLQALAPSDVGSRPVRVGSARPLDVRRLLAFAGGSHALARGLVDDVVAAAPADLAELRTALACADSPRVLRAVHRLHGALAQVAAVPAVRTLARVAALHVAGAPRVLDALLAELETDISELPRGLGPSSATSDHRG